MSLQNGCVPDKLKVAKVIPVFKKGDRSQPANYHPISLLSIFDKLLEKLMYNKLVSYLDCIIISLDSGKITQLL